MCLLSTAPLAKYFARGVRFVLSAIKTGRNAIKIAFRPDLIHDKNSKQTPHMPLSMRRSSLSMRRSPLSMRNLSLSTQRSSLSMRREFAK